MQLSKHVTPTESGCIDILFGYVVTGVTLVVTLKTIDIDIFYIKVTTVTTYLPSRMKDENIYSPYRRVSTF